MKVKDKNSLYKQVIIKDKLLNSFSPIIIDSNDSAVNGKYYFCKLNRHPRPLVLRRGNIPIRVYRLLGSDDYVQKVFNILTGDDGWSKTLSGAIHVIKNVLENPKSICYAHVPDNIYDTSAFINAGHDFYRLGMGYGIYWDDLYQLVKRHVPCMIKYGTLGVHPLDDDGFINELETDEKSDMSKLIRSSVMIRNSFIDAARRVGTKKGYLFRQEKNYPIYPIVPYTIDGYARSYNNMRSVISPCGTNAKSYYDLWGMYHIFRKFSFNYKMMTIATRENGFKVTLPIFDVSLEGPLVIGSDADRDYGYASIPRVEELEAKGVTIDNGVVQRVRKQRDKMEVDLGGLPEDYIQSCPNDVGSTVWTQRLVTERNGTYSSYSIGSILIGGTGLMIDDVNSAALLMWNGKTLPSLIHYLIMLNNVLARWKVSDLVVSHVDRLLRIFNSDVYKYERSAMGYARPLFMVRINIGEATILLCIDTVNRCIHGTESSLVRFAKEYITQGGEGFRSDEVLAAFLDFSQGIEQHFSESTVKEIFNALQHWDDLTGR